MFAESQKGLISKRFIKECSHEVDGKLKLSIYIIFAQNVSDHFNVNSHRGCEARVE